MAKLTLKTVVKARGVGTLTEKTIKFVGSDGEEFEGEVLVKMLSHDEIQNARNVWNLKNPKEATFDQLTKAIIFESIYTAKDERFFPTVDSTGEVSTEIMDALYNAADQVNDFAGKKWISKRTNSGVNSSSTESAEEQSKKQSET